MIISYICQNFNNFHFPQSYEYEFQSGIFPFYLRLFLMRNGLLRPFRVFFIAVFGRGNPEF